MRKLFAVKWAPGPRAMLIAVALVTALPFLAGRAQAQPVPAPTASATPSSPTQPAPAPTASETPSAAPEAEHHIPKDFDPCGGFLELLNKIGNGTACVFVGGEA